MSNRSSGRRRRSGRPSSSRGPSDGNRQTHRNSGNAHQLLDKYKNLARDSHQQGDRVMNEYYLQFADHYFRILAEVNDRKEENKRDREDTRGSRTDDRQESGSANDQTSSKGSSSKASSSKSDAAKSGIAKSDDKGGGPSRRSSPSSKKTDDGARDGEELKISADALPGAVPIETSAKEMNGKSTAKKTSSTRSRSKPSDGEGASAEA